MKKSEYHWNPPMRTASLPPSYITVTKGLRGYFAVQFELGQDIGMHEPAATHPESRATIADAERDALSWAEAEGIPYISRPSMPQQAQKSAHRATAFGISYIDVEDVLRRNCLKVANTNGRTFEDIANELLPGLDTAAIEAAALAHDSMEDQTSAAQEEIHRQLWKMGIIKTGPDRLEARERLIDALSRDAATQNPADLVEIFRGGFPGYQSMTDDELVIHAYNAGLDYEIPHDILMLRVDVPRYITGTWTHLFGPGSRDTTLRIVYDREEERLIAGQYQDGPLGAWRDLRRDDLSDVEDSLENANPEALLRPADAGLQVSFDLPAWAQLADSETVEVTNRPRG